MSELRSQAQVCLTHSLNGAIHSAGYSRQVVSVPVRRERVRYKERDRENHLLQS